MSTLLLLRVLWAAFRSPSAAPTRSAADDEERLRGLLARHGDRDSLGYFALRRDKSVVWSPRAARPRSPTAWWAGCRWPPAIRSATPRPGRARSRRWLAEAGSTRWVAGRDGRQRGGRHGLRPARPGRPGARRRSDRGDRASSPSTGARCAPCGRRTTGCERAGYTVRIRRHEDIPATEMERLLRAGRRLARRGDRARLLDGAGPARRPGRRPLRDGRVPRTRDGRAAGAAQLRAVGPRRGCRSI